MARDFPGAERYPSLEENLPFLYIFLRKVVGERAGGQAVLSLIRMYIRILPMMGYGACICLPT